MSLTRRNLLSTGLGVVGMALLDGCSDRSATGGRVISLPAQESLRPAPGQSVVNRTLIAAPATIDLGGPTVATWAFDETLPGPLIRARAGDLVRVDLHNRLDDETTIHWHGVALRNAADGVPGLTQEPVSPGGRHLYEFVVPDPGTYFYHPHVGVQLDRALYAPLIIDDPNEPGEYDHEWVVVLDDWIDGTGSTPDEVFNSLSRPPGSGMDDDMDMGGGDGADKDPAAGLYGDAGDVTYPYFLINGRVSAAPDRLSARPGQRVRIRVINAAADTIFTVALGGHRLTVTHTDGFAVQPRETSAFFVGMGERYDVVTTLEDGVFPLVALPLGKAGVGLALIRTGKGQAPTAASAPALSELDTPILVGTDLVPAESSRLPQKDVGQEVELTLTGQMSPYAWAINGRAYPDNELLEIVGGRRVAITITNQTTMTHPMHLHGHTFALPNGLRKDTVLLAPRQRLDVQFQADNPGNWAAHCHNIYHAEAGMMAALVYTT